MTMKRFAANHVDMGRGLLHQAVVELEEGVVTRVYEFQGELPSTEWLPGTISLVCEQGLLRAYYQGIRLQ